MPFYTSVDRAIEKCRVNKNVSERSMPFIRYALNYGDMSGGGWILQGPVIGSRATENDKYTKVAKNDGYIYAFGW